MMNKNGNSSSNPNNNNNNNNNAIRIIYYYMIAFNLFVSRGVADAFSILTIPSPAAVTRTTTTTTTMFSSVMDAEEIIEDFSSNKTQENVNKKSGILPNVVKRIVKRRTNTNNTNNIREITTLQDYKKYVVDEDDKITVVRFYAPWCRSCKAMASKYRKMAYDTNYSQYVNFIEVPLSQETAFLHTGLNVPSLPYGHIYHPIAGLVEELKINKNVFKTFEYVLNTYVQGHCNLDDYDIYYNSEEDTSSSTNQ